MIITVFSKKKKTREGKEFTAYIGKLHKKDGYELTASVKFRKECGSPKASDCPMNVEFPKEKANLSSQVYTREDTGEEATSYTLWVSEWKKSAVPYRDSSLDDFE